MLVATLLCFVRAVRNDLGGDLITYVSHVIIEIGVVNQVYVNVGLLFQIVAYMQRGIC
jgi:hypothetical protein